MVDAVVPRNITPYQTVKPVVGSKDKAEKSKKKEEPVKEEEIDEEASRKGRRVDDHA